VSVLDSETGRDLCADVATPIAIARELCRTSRELRATSRLLLQHLASHYALQAVIHDDNAARANSSARAKTLRAHADHALRHARRLQALADRSYASGRHPGDDGDRPP
jgi:hypothetical protein